jgi:hypothetical protein
MCKLNKNKGPHSYSLCHLCVHNKTEIHISVTYEDRFIISYFLLESVNIYIILAFYVNESQIKFVYKLMK